jgi:hypothetical protein
MKSIAHQILFTFIASILCSDSDAAISGRQTLSRSPSSSNTSIDYFHQRWNNNSNNNNNVISSTKSSLQFLPIPTQSVLDSRPVKSLSVRGGGSSSIHRYTVPTTFVANLARTLKPTNADLDKFETFVHVSPISVAELVEAKVNDNTERHNRYSTHDRGVLKPSIQTTAEQILTTYKTKRSEAIFAASEAIFFAGTHLETLWSNACPKVVQWFEEGRSEQGLFRIETWKRSTGDRLILQKAWDRQFRTKRIQLAIGCTAGFAVAPAISFVGKISVILTTATYLAAELKRRLPRDSKRRMFRNNVRIIFNSIGNSVEAGLENCRNEIINLFQQPQKITQNVLIQSLRDDVWIPSSVQRGLVVGIILGLASIFN